MRCGDGRTLQAWWQRRRVQQLCHPSVPVFLKLRRAAAPQIVNFEKKEPLFSIKIPEILVCTLDPKKLRNVGVIQKIEDKERCRCHIFVSPKGNEIVRGIRKAATECSRANRERAAAAAAKSNGAGGADGSNAGVSATAATGMELSPKAQRGGAKMSKEQYTLCQVHLFLEQLAYVEEGLKRMIGIYIYEEHDRKVLVKLCESIPLNAVIRVSEAGFAPVNGYYKLEKDGDGMITWPKCVRVSSHARPAAPRARRCTRSCASNPLRVLHVRRLGALMYLVGVLCKTLAVLL